MENYPKNLPAAIASRVSTEEQKKGENIESHIDELKKLMKEHGNFLWDEKLGIYKDEGYSGALLERPELDRLRDDALASRFKVVYFLSPGC